MILKVENIAKVFGKNKVLKNVTFEMNSCALYGIVGENRSGKSTLLKIIVGEWKSDGGKISTTGRLGYCPQQILLFPQLTIDEHFRYFAAAYGIYISLLIILFVPIRHLPMFIFGLMLIGFVYGCHGLAIGSLIKGKLEGVFLILALLIFYNKMRIKK